MLGKIVFTFWVHHPTPGAGHEMDMMGVYMNGITP
jgi:hypothetical protein